MPLANTIQFGTVILDGGTQGNYISNFSVKKVHGTLKQRLNENLSMIAIPGRAKEYEIIITGALTGGNRDNDESTLKTYDNGSVRQYVDGVHDGNYIIVPESLEFPKDNARTKTINNYRMTIRQVTQTL